MIKTKELASVIEPSAELEIVCEPLAIVTNVAGVEAYIDNLIEPYITGEIDVSTDELEADARKDLADLNKKIKAVDDRRKEEIKALRSPIDEVDTAVKEIVKKGQDGYRRAKDAIDEKIAENERKRKEDLITEYRGIVGDEVATLIPYDLMCNPSWVTKSYSKKKTETELFDKASRIVDEIRTLNEQDLKFKDHCIKHYTQNLDLGSALKVNSDMIAEEEAAEKKRIEAEEAFKLRKAEEEQRAAERRKQEEEAAAARARADEATPEILQEPEPVIPVPLPKIEQPDNIKRGSYVILMENVSIFDAQEAVKAASEKLGRRLSLREYKGA